MTTAIGQLERERNEAKAAVARLESENAQHQAKMTQMVEEITRLKTQKPMSPSPPSNIIQMACYFLDTRAFEAKLDEQVWSLTSKSRSSFLFVRHDHPGVEENLKTAKHSTTIMVENSKYYLFYFAQTSHDGVKAWFDGIGNDGRKNIARPYWAWYLDPKQSKMNEKMMAKKAVRVRMMKKMDKNKDIEQEKFKK